jgi:hypothetical protein
VILQNISNEILTSSFQKERAQHQLSIGKREYENSLPLEWEKNNKVNRRRFYTKRGLSQSAW